MFLSEIINLLKIDMVYKDCRIKNIKIDSREIKKGDLFICINKGHNYINEALKKGAKAVIVDQDININTKISIIKVENTILTLGQIAKYFRKQYQHNVIAITGSNGKTTTKELLKHLLSKQYKVLTNEGSQNNHIGVPNTLLKLNNKYDYVILELGTNHPGEIAYLSDIVNPTIALITNIGYSHIGNFDSLNCILEEKLNIKRKDTVLFVNGEDKLLNKVAAIKVYKNDYDYKSFIEHYQINYNLAFKVCEYLNISREVLYKNVEDFTLINSRMNIININNITIIDDAYNASFESIVGGLDYLKKYKHKIIILADMLELGKYSYELHKRVYKKIKKLDNYELFTLGNFTKCMKKGKHFNDREALCHYFDTYKLNNGDVIYLKGANKFKLYELVPYLKKLCNNHKI